MIPAVSQVCTLASPFEKDVEDYAAAHCNAIEIWLTKLETYIQQHSLEKARALLAEYGLQAPVASFQGGLLVSQGEARRVAWELFRSRLATCSQLGVDVLVVACDAEGALSGQDVARLRASLAEAAQAAAQAGVRLALEPQASSSLGNNLQTAAALAAETNSPHLGICLDLFHFYVGPSKLQDLAVITAENLFHVQLCDLADTPREFAADAQRILPGDGDIHLAPILEHLRQIDYRGCVSIEVMNPQFWQSSPLTFSEIAITALRKQLGQADLGSDNT